MSRFVSLLVFVAVCLVVGCGSNPSDVRSMETSEALEQSAGDEATLEGRNPNDMDDWESPGNEVEAEMEAEPYPE